MASIEGLSKIGTHGRCYLLKSVSLWRKEMEDMPPTVVLYQTTSDLLRYCDNFPMQQDPFPPIYPVKHINPNSTKAPQG